MSGIRHICRLLKRERQPLIITITGRMGSGKTTLAHALHTCFRDYKKVELGDISEEALSALSTDGAPGLYLIFDDYSFKITGKSEADRQKLNVFFRIRHITGLDNIVVVLCIHYVRSIAPFLRAAQVRILTSVTEPEIRMYSNDYLFTPSSLWDYLYYQVHEPDRYIVLVGTRMGEHIVDVTMGRKRRKRKKE